MKWSWKVMESGCDRIVAVMYTPLIESVMHGQCSARRGNLSSLRASPSFGHRVAPLFYRKISILPVE